MISNGKKGKGKGKRKLNIKLKKLHHLLCIEYSNILVLIAVCDAVLLQLNHFSMFDVLKTKERKNIIDCFWKNENWYLEKREKLIIFLLRKQALEKLICATKKNSIKS